MKKYKFSVIIANYNGEKYLLDCLTSVFKTDYPKFEVIIVEDGSTDGSLKIIDDFQQKYSFTLIQNIKNIGLVKSRNKAIKKASGDILVFLDNDTSVDKNWLTGFAKTFNKDKSIAAAQSIILDFKKRDTIQEIGMKLNPYTGFGNPLGRGEKNFGQFSNLQEIIALGACLAVRKEVAKKIKGFDEMLFHYTDDLDFSWRIWILGKRIVSSPNTYIYHYTKIHKPTFDLYFHLSKNSFRMIIKNYEFINVVKFLPLSFCFNIMGGIVVLIKTKRIIALLGVIVGLLWNLLFLIDTLKERTNIQTLRKIKDKYILSKITIATNLFTTMKIYFHTAKLTVFLMKENK